MDPLRINPELIENDTVQITEVDDELAIEHKPTGRTLVLDDDVRASDLVDDELTSDVDGKGYDISNLGALSTEEADIKERNLTLGQNAEAGDNDSTVLGGDAQTDQGETVIIGTDASTEGTSHQSVVIGPNAQTTDNDETGGSQQRSTVIGSNAYVQNNHDEFAARAVAIGDNSFAGAHSTTALGSGAEAQEFRSTALGRDAQTDMSNSVAVGWEARCENIRGIAIGSQAYVEDGQFQDAIAIGKEAHATGGSGAVTIGQGSGVDGEAAVSIGRDADARSSGAIGIGRDVVSEGSGSIAIGRDAEAGVGGGANNGIAIGRGAVASDGEWVVAIDQSTVFKMTDNGDMEITGELTENASL